MLHGRLAGKRLTTVAAIVWRCPGDRAANVTDCRSVSWGFDSLPGHSILSNPAVMENVILDHGHGPSCGITANKISRVIESTKPATVYFTDSLALFKVIII